MYNILLMLIYLFVGYLVGLWLAASGLFSATVTLTVWSNLWVYVWLLFWPVMLLWHFITWAILISLVLVVVFLIIQKLLS